VDAAHSLNPTKRKQTRQEIMKKNGYSAMSHTKQSVYRNI